MTALETVVRAGRSDWSSWVPVLLRALEDTAELVAQFRGLSLDDQYVLLTRTRVDGGPYADGVLLLLADTLRSSDDPQVREFLAWDAVDAAGRRVDAFSRWHQELVSAVGVAQRPVADGMRAAADAAQLEKRLIELRASGIGTDHERVCELEHDIAVLETRRTALAGCDLDAMAGRRDRLAVMVDELEQAASAVGAQVGELQEQRVVAEAQLADHRDAAAVARADLGRLHTDLERETAAAVDVRARLDEVAEEQRTVRLELEQVRASLAQRSALLEADRGRLAELRGTQLGERAGALIAAVDELIRDLPADLAEPMFDNGRGTPS